MSSFFSAIASLLRATEVPLVSVDAHVLPNASTKSLPVFDTSDNWQDRRVLAVVSHKDEWALSEEGALFVYKLKSSLNSVNVTPELQNIYPIYGKFLIVMSQMRRNTLDLGVVTAKAVLGQPRSGFCLSITPAEGVLTGEDPPTFYATDVQSLGVLVAESKRLREAAEVENPETVHISQSSSHFSWLRPYVSKPVYLSHLSLIPPDLRVLNQPLLQRLSPASAGQSGEDAADIQLIRDEWIRENARTSVRQERQSLSVRLGTFNVNGKFPSQDLSSWIQGTALFNHGTSSSTPSLTTVSSDTAANSSADSTKTYITKHVDDSLNPDILAIGFQELDLSTEALIYSTGTAREEAWSLAIFAALGEKSVHYEKLTSKQLVGMLIIVLVKKSLRNCFGNIQVCSAGSGILGLMGNKGATAIRLTFTPHQHTKDSENHQGDPTSDENDVAPFTLTFVNAHLAAFDEMVDKRNQEFHELSRRLTFGRSINVFEIIEQEATEQQLTPTTISIYETDVLFWMGDLNYRVDLPDAEFRNLLADREWVDRLQVLIRFDQLKKSMSSSKAFEGFLEYEVNYLPTYRFNSDSGKDGLGYDQKRRPAWTDRILHISSPFCNVKQLSYNSYPKITMSDHRPVAANFVVHFDLYEQSEYESTVKHLYHKVHDMDGPSERPTIKIDQSFLDFGEIKYNSSPSKRVIIENAGKVPCAWRFISPQIGSPIHPDWLIVGPTVGMLLPGEKTEIAVAVQINKSVAASLNLGPRDMNGTLILHTVLGKDHFIAVSGEYLPSCLGNKLTTLTQLPGPIRTLTSSETLRGTSQPLNAPSEIMRLVNRLMSNAHPPEDLFLLTPDEGMVATIRECLDTGEEFPWPPGEGEIEAKASHALAQTLIDLLDSLIEPIVPPMIHSRCVQTTSRDEAFELLDALQPAAINVWITVTAFLHFVCQSSKVSGYTERIATIFTSVLMRDDPTSIALPISPVAKRNFFLHFIT